MANDAKKIVNARVVNKTFISEMHLKVINKLLMQEAALD